MYVVIITIVLSIIVASFCAAGAGLLIKPFLTIFTNFSVDKINFITSISVFFIAVLSLIYSRNDKNKLRYDILVPLGIGAIIGGIYGRFFLDLINSNRELVQDIVFLLVVIFLYYYEIIKSKIKTMNIDNKFICLSLGYWLGITSSFLGIGSGPLNIIVLYVFFSTKNSICAKESSFLVFLSQGSYLVTTIIGDGLPSDLYTIDLISIIFFVTISYVISIYLEKLKLPINDAKLHKILLILIIIVSLINLTNVL